MGSQLRSQIHFWLAVLVLASSGIAMHIAKSRGSLRVLKKPLPIRKNLSDFNRETLAPFEFLSSQKLSPDIEEALGTKEYIDWVLRDPNAKKGRSSRILLTVTYYTDVQDQVPHVPEECYFQGAFSPAGDDSLDMKMDSLGKTIPVRRLAFYPPREFSKKTYVYYTICVNGEFHCNRNRVRLRMANPYDTHLYYSKIEICYQRVINEDLSILDRGAHALLDKIIDELTQSHWPEKGAERGGKVNTRTPLTLLIRRSQLQEYRKCSNDGRIGSHGPQVIIAGGLALKDRT